jgi:hypothetical protein
MQEQHEMRLMHQRRQSDGTLLKKRTHPDDEQANDDIDMRNGAEEELE